MGFLRAVKRFAKKKEIGFRIRERGRKGPGNEALARETRIEFGRVKRSRVGGKIPHNERRLVSKAAAERAGKRLAAKYALDAIGIRPGKERNQIMRLLERYEILRADRMKGNFKGDDEFCDLHGKISDAAGKKILDFWGYYERSMGRERTERLSEGPL